MALQECANGHIYDTDQFPRCPYCGGGTNMISFDGGSSIGKTVAAGPAAPAGPSAVGSTVAPQSYIKGHDNKVDTGKTVGVFQRKLQFDPVVGWLVCIEGPDKGKDFRVFGRNNSIGRSESMDICIKNDKTISRENHARVSYDQKHNTFYIVPAESANTIYLNDQPVYVPAILGARDIIELGEGKFMFIPFCDDSFTWKNDSEQGE